MINSEFDYRPQDSEEMFNPDPQPQSPGVIYPTVSSEYVLHQRIEGIGVTTNDLGDENSTEHITLNEGELSDVFYNDMPHKSLLD